MLNLTLHRNVDLQAEDLLLILIEHLALDAVGSSGRAEVEDGLLDDRDLTRGLRAGQTVDVDVARADGEINDGILAEVTTLGEHSETTIRTSELPGSSSHLLVQKSVTVHGGVHSGDNRVVLNHDGVELSMSISSGADGVGDGSGLGQDGLGITRYHYVLQRSGRERTGTS